MKTRRASKRWLTAADGTALPRCIGLDGLCWDDHVPCPHGLIPAPDGGDLEQEFFTSIVDVLKAKDSKGGRR